MHRHEGYAVGALAFDQVEEFLRVEPVRVAVFAGRLAEGLVERHVAHRQIHAGDHLTPHPVQVASHGEFHQGVGPAFHGCPRFCHLGLVVDDVGGGADGGVDLGAQAEADAGCRGLAAVVPGDDDPPLGHHATHELRRKGFVRGHCRHLWGDDALAGGFDLGFHGV